MQVSLHSYSTSTGYHPTIKIVGFLARKFYKKGFRLYQADEILFLLFLGQFVCLEIGPEGVDLALDVQVCEGPILGNKIR